MKCEQCNSETQNGFVCPDCSKISDLNQGEFYVCNKNCQKLFWKDHKKRRQHVQGGLISENIFNLVPSSPQSNQSCEITTFLPHIVIFLNFLIVTRQDEDTYVVVYVLMPCPFTGPKMFCAGPKFLCQTTNLFTYCGSHKHFVPVKKMICIQ